MAGDEGTPTKDETPAEELPHARPAMVADAPKATKREPVEVGPDPSPPEGYIGFAPGAEETADHTLLTGPDGPALAGDDRTAVVQPALPKEFP